MRGVRESESERGARAGRAEKRATPGARRPASVHQRRRIAWRLGRGSESACCYGSQRRLDGRPTSFAGGSENDEGLQVVHFRIPSGAACQLRGRSLYRDGLGRGFPWVRPLGRARCRPPRGGLVRVEMSNEQMSKVRVTGASCESFRSYGRRSLAIHRVEGLITGKSKLQAPGAGSSKVFTLTLASRL